MSLTLLAFSISTTFTKVGAIAAFAGLLGIAVLSLLVFSQAREIRRLREWAGRAPERSAEIEQRVTAAASARAQQPPPVATAGRPAVRAEPLHARPVATPATPGAPVPPVPAGQALTAAGAPATAAQTPAAQPGAQPPGAPAVTPPSTPVPAVRPPQPATAAAASAAAASATAPAPTPPGATAQPTPPAATPAGQGGQPGPAAPVAPGSAPKPIPWQQQPGQGAAPATPPLGAPAAAGAAAGAAAARPAAPAGNGASAAPPRAPMPPRAQPVVAQPPAQPEATRPPLPPAPAAPRRGVPAARAEQAGAGRAASRAVGASPASDRVAEGRGGGRSRRGLIAVALGVLVVIVLAVVLLTRGGSSPHGATGTATTVAGQSIPKRKPAKVPAKPAKATPPAETDVIVLNGTEATGLAARVASQLQQGGYSQAAARYGRPPGANDATVVEYSSGHQADAEGVAHSLSVSHVQPVEQAVAALSGGAKVVVIVGANQVEQSTTSP